MNTAVLKDVQVALALVDQLNQWNIHSVVAGGAARDILHDRVPKDYDLVVMDNYELVEVVVALEQIGATCVEPFGHEASMAACDDDKLDWVVKFRYKDVPFDIIQHARLPSDPQEVMEAFDCTLNMVYLNDEGAPVKHPDFPEPGGRVEIRPLCDLPQQRVRYLSQKYPQYQWPSDIELMAHPNYHKGT